MAEISVGYYRVMLLVYPRALGGGGGGGGVNRNTQQKVWLIGHCYETPARAKKVRSLECSDATMDNHVREIVSETEPGETLEDDRENQKFAGKVVTARDRHLDVVSKLITSVICVQATPGLDSTNLPGQFVSLVSAPDPTEGWHRDYGQFYLTDSLVRSTSHGTTISC